jgi:hypothetical protein
MFMREMENDLNKKDKGLDNFLTATCCERQSDFLHPSLLSLGPDKCVLNFFEHNNSYKGQMK